MLGLCHHTKALIDAPLSWHLPHASGHAVLVRASSWDGGTPHAFAALLSLRSCHCLWLTHRMCRLLAETVQRAVCVHRKRQITCGSGAQARRGAAGSASKSDAHVDTRGHGVTHSDEDDAVTAAACPEPTLLTARPGDGVAHDAARAACMLTSSDLREVLPQLLLDFA